MTDKLTPMLTDPSQVPANWKSVLPAKRKTVIDYPGQVSVHTAQGQVGGCRLVQFCDGRVIGLQAADYADLMRQVEEDGSGRNAVDLINTYWRHRENLFIAALHVVAPGNIYVAFSTTMDAADLDDFHVAGAYTAVVMQAYRGEATLEELQESYDDVRKMVLEKALERDEAAVAKKLEAEQAAEKARLEKLGRTAEQQGWASRILKLETELSDLSAKLKASKGAPNADS